MTPVSVIGMGLSLQDLTAGHLKLIQSADILVGGRRLLAEFDDLLVEKEVISTKIDETIAFIRTHMADRRIVVLASGDPLFYGIGVRLSRELGADRVTIFPNVSSIAAAFARIHEPWGNATVISLHGRDQRGELLAAMKTNRVTAVLTDRTHTPTWLADWLLKKGVRSVRLAIFEQLGVPDEHVGWYTLSKASDMSFASPNVVIIKPIRDEAAVDPYLGMDDSFFEHEKGLITKAEVRAVSLSKLCLAPGQTLWDLGAGSGAVGIEASVLLGPGRIIAIEQEQKRVSQIRANAQKMGVYNLDVHQAVLPGDIKGLPQPDRVFIGGGGRHLESIIATAAHHLRPDGIIVANTVLIDNLTTAVAALTSAGMTTEVVQIQVNRSKKMPWSERLQAHNPVWIVTGAKDITDDPS